MATDSQATLLESFKISKDIKCLQFKINSKEKHIPGQYYTIKTREEDTVVAREYSLSNAVNCNGIIELGVQKVQNGVVSTLLHSIKPGAEIVVSGPGGKYFNWESKHKGPVVFIAGGAGIVPFMSMLRTYKTHEFYLIGSFKTVKHIPYYKELLKFQKDNKNFHLLATLTREEDSKWKGLHGRITSNLFKKHKIINKNSLVYICGRTNFVEDIYQMLLEIGVNKNVIKKEYFG